MATVRGSFSVLASLLFLAAALSGCHGLDDTNETAGSSTPPPSSSTSTTPPTSSTSPTSTSPTTSTTPPPEPLDITLAFTGTVADEAAVDDVLSFNVSVTGESGSTTHAGGHYSFTSTANLTDESLDPSDFEGAMPHSAATFNFPGSYRIENWTVPDSDVVYIRAHILTGGKHYWSVESRINITDGTAPPPPPDVEQGNFVPDEVITIGSVTGGAIANWGTLDATISVGQAVQWQNQDDAPHTATSSASPAEWDTGTIQANSDSLVYRFNTAGTYDYHCTIHPNMLTASITVS